MKKKYINTKLGIIDRYNESFWFSYFNAYLNLEKSREDICNELDISMKVLCTIFKNIGYLDKYRDEINKVSQEWYKITTFNKYGTDNIFKTEYAKNKAKQTKKEKYGDENYVNPNKSKKTKEVRYGDSNYNNRGKSRDTCLKRYGVTTYTQTGEYLSKYKQTCLEKYGVESHNQDKTVREKQVDTLITNYGVNVPLKSEEILNKVKETNIDRYGVENVFQIEEIKNKIQQDNLNSIEHINEKWLDNNYTLLDEYLGLRDDNNNYIIYNFKCNKCNTKFKGYFCSGMIRCTGCFPRHKSIPQQLIENFIEEKGFKIISNSKSLISPYEIDIYVPELNIGFEYNGYIYHLEESVATEEEKIRLKKWIKPDGYHEMKKELCKNKNITLYYLWEGNKQDNLSELLKQVEEILKNHRRK